MFIGNTDNNYNKYIQDQVGHLPDLNIISFYDRPSYVESILSQTCHNILLFPLIDSFDEPDFSSFGWKCAIKSAFIGEYTVTSIFMVSPDSAIIDDCVNVIKTLINRKYIVDNIWLWPNEAITPSRNTEVSNLLYQTRKHEYH